MDRQPTLEGPRVLLRPLSAEDWSALWAVARDRQIWAGHPSHDRWQEPVFRAFFDDALARGGALAIVDKESGAIIGSSRFQEYRPAGPGGSGGEVEIGWSFLQRAFWGRGYNAEFKRLMLVHAFLWVERVLFRVGADNAISRRAMEKIGGRLTGETFIAERAGRPMQHVIYAITRDEFASGPLAG